MTCILLGTGVFWLLSTSYAIGAPESSFDYFSIFQRLRDGVLIYLSLDNLGIVLRAMVPTKNIYFENHLVLGALRPSPMLSKS